MAKKMKKSRRFYLTVPEDIAEFADETAEEFDTTTVEILRRFLKVGYIARKLEKSPQDPSDGMFIRKNGVDRFITFEI